MKNLRAVYSIRTVPLSIDIAYREYYRVEVYNGKDKKIAMSKIPNDAHLVETVKDGDYWTKYYESEDMEIIFSKDPF